MNYRYLLAIAVAASLLATACRREPAEVFVPAGHPADPYAQPARPVPIPTALRPEFESVRPKVGTGSPPAQPADSTEKPPPSGHHQH